MTDYPKTRYQVRMTENTRERLRIASIKANRPTWEIIDEALRDWLAAHEEESKP